MSYNYTNWRKRLAERSDISSSVTHLTRGPKGKEANANAALEILLTILKDEKIKGSTTSSGFINGSRRAVCFQDAPPQFLAQNVYFERKYRQTVPDAKVRYLAFGLIFGKTYAFQQGARPVIYDRTDDAKKYLSQRQWWRIVNLDLDDKKKIIDWTHEREWRCPGDFPFKRDRATVILPDRKSYRRFVERAKEIEETFEINILSDIRGFVDLYQLLY
jgi:hypothetical protein